MNYDTPSSSKANWFAVIGCTTVILCFYQLLNAYGPGRAQSLFEVLQDSWNSETRYEHGFFYPLIIIGMIAYKWKDIKKSIGSGENWGLIPLMIGLICFVLAYRVIQWRVGIGALPFILHGVVWYLWGRKVALITAFPIYYIWLSVPLPNIQQATIPLQNASIKISEWICSICGVATYADGSMIKSLNNKWEPLEVAESCSGIRSLMALIMISSAWAYIASSLSLWKRAILLVSALPLAIIGNGLRVASIFVMAEYGNEEFARKTWHDNSGLLLFYPISLIMLMILHALLEGWRPWQKKVTRKTVTSPKTISVTTS